MKELNNIKLDFVKVSHEDVEILGNCKINPKIILVNGKSQLLDCNVNKNLKEPELIIEKVRITTSNSYKNNNNHTNKWSEQETLKFYRVNLYMIAI